MRVRRPSRSNQPRSALRKYQEGWGQSRQSRRAIKISLSRPSPPSPFPFPSPPCSSPPCSRAYITISPSFIDRRPARGSSVVRRARSSSNSCCACPRLQGANHRLNTATRRAHPNAGHKAQSSSRPLPSPAACTTRISRFLYSCPQASSCPKKSARGSSSARVSGVRNSTRVAKDSAARFPETTSPAYCPKRRANMISHRSSVSPRVVWRMRIPR